eukprot:Em0021g761a
MRTNLKLLLLVALLAVASSALDVHDSTSQLNFTSGELTVVLNKSPWQMTIIDRVTQLNLLTETSDSEYRLGFGKWDGIYLDIYEGYLFRVGLIVEYCDVGLGTRLIVEWYSAQDVVSWSNGSDSLSVLVSASGPSGRYIQVNFTDFQARQFSLHATVVGAA